MSKSRTRRPNYFKEYRATHRLQLNEKAQRERASQKAAVLTYYGKGLMKCVWVGCEVCDPDMLTIDHIDNGGTQDRKHNGRGGHDFYRRLQKQGYPDGYQTLCANHQLKKEIDRRRNIPYGKRVFLHELLKD